MNGSDPASRPEHGPGHGGQPARRERRRQREAHRGLRLAKPVSHHDASGDERGLDRRRGLQQLGGGEPHREPHLGSPRTSAGPATRAGVGRAGYDSHEPGDACETLYAAGTAVAPHYCIQPRGQLDRSPAWPSTIRAATRPPTPERSSSRTTTAEMHLRDAEGRGRPSRSGRGSDFRLGLVRGSRRSRPGPGGRHRLRRLRRWPRPEDHLRRAERLGYGQSHVRRGAAARPVRRLGLDGPRRSPTPGISMGTGSSTTRPPPSPALDLRVRGQLRGPSSTCTDAQGASEHHGADPHQRGQHAARAHDHDAERRL